MRGIRFIVAAALFAIGTGATPASAAQVGAGQATDGYPRQSISWHGCRIGADDRVGTALDAAGAQCGEVTVPLDYARPGGRMITVALSRIKAADPAHRRGVLMIDPGGPGVPAMPQVLLNQYMPTIAARYDLVGMDPRFVGRSTPLECAWTTDTFLRSAGPDRRSFDETVALDKSLAAGCAKGNRDLLPYASTRDTARDMDVVRAAIGEGRLSYLGVSYGTYLGAVYLQMFGARADRFVLDSAVDPDVYGANLFSLAGPADVAALAHWASWAAARDGEYGLGSTPAAVLSTVENAVRRPVRIGGMLVDTHVLPYIIFAHLYDDSDEAYAGFAADVRVLRDPSLPPSAELTEFLAGVLTGTGDATDRAGTPILCADRAVSRDPNTYFRDIQAHRGDEGIFGPLTRDISPCAFWPTTPIEPPTTVHNGVPVLLLGADGDPAAPYPGQLSMHRALAGSRMVTLRGAFRHGTFLVGGSPCVDDTVDRYLVDGVLPDGDTSCTRS